MIAGTPIADIYLYSQHHVVPCPSSRVVQGEVANGGTGVAWRAWEKVKSVRSDLRLSFSRPGSEIRSSSALHASMLHLLNTQSLLSLYLGYLPM